MRGELVRSFLLGRRRDELSRPEKKIRKLEDSRRKDENSSTDPRPKAQRLQVGVPPKKEMIMTYNAAETRDRKEKDREEMRRLRQTMNRATVANYPSHQDYSQTNGKIVSDIDFSASQGSRTIPVPPEIKMERDNKRVNRNDSHGERGRKPRQKNMGGDTIRTKEMDPRFSVDWE